jgi:hypothetical protein
MHTLSVICDVPPNRVVTLKLPETVSPGQHELLVVIDTPNATPRFQELSPAAQVQHLAALQARWRERLSSSDTFAQAKAEEIILEERGGSDARHE